MEIEWSSQLVMPDLDGKKNPGTAGAYIGINNNHLIVAGGAFFPDVLPWHGGRKHWSKDVYVLNLEGQVNEWHVLKNELPEAIAYGSSVSTPIGVLCIGGSDSNRCYSDVNLMTYENDSVKFIPWVPLPYPLSNCCASIVDNIVFVAGGQQTVADGEASHAFLSIDISKPEKGWVELPSWDGVARGYAVGVAKRVGEDILFYLFSGRNYGSKITAEVLSDGYVYNANTLEWKNLEGNFPLMAATAVNLDDELILLAGGTDGSIFMKEVELKTKINKYVGDETQRDSLLYYQNQLSIFFENVKGFDSVVRFYNTSTNTIVNTESIDYLLPLTTTAVTFNQNVYIISGEIRPGVRSPYIIKGSILQ